MYGGTRSDSLPSRLGECGLQTEASRDYREEVYGAVADSTEEIDYLRNLSLMCYICVQP